MWMDQREVHIGDGVGFAAESVPDVVQVQAAGASAGDPGVTEADRSPLDRGNSPGRRDLLNNVYVCCLAYTGCAAANMKQNANTIRKRRKYQQKTCSSP